MRTALLLSSFAALSLIAAPAYATSCASAADCWNGGTANWSNAGSWSTGAPPTSGQNTFINTGADDVTLDLSATIGDLTLGPATGSSLLSNTSQTLTLNGVLSIGAAGTFNVSNGLVQVQGSGTSNIAGALNISNNSLVSFAGDVTNSGSIVTNYANTPSSVNPNVLSVSGTFTNNSNAVLDIGRFEDTKIGANPGDSATLNSLVNNGTVTIERGASLTVTNGITDIATGSALTVNGTIDGLAGLATVEGTLAFGNQMTTTISGPVTNSGSFYVGDSGSGGTSAGTVVEVTGDLTNSNLVQVENGGTLTVDGTFQNQAGATFEIGAYGAANANVNALSLAGTVQIDQGSTLNITGGGSGVTDIASNATLIQNGTFEVSGSTNALANLATVEGTLELGNQATTTVNGSIGNTGSIYVGDSGTGAQSAGTVLDVKGNLTNSNLVQVEKGGTLTVEGTFTNQAAATFEVGAYGAANANVNALSLAGTVQIDQGSTLNITGGGSGVTDVASNTTLIQNGTFEVSGSTNALANLATVEGTLELGNGETTTIASLQNSGNVYVGDCGNGSQCGGTTLHVTGGLTNSSLVQVEFGATLNVDGTMTNSATFEVGAYGAASSTINTLSNSGTTTVDTGSTLNVTTLTNGATVRVGSTAASGGVLNATTITNNGTMTVGYGGGAATVNAATFTNSAGATLSLTSGSTLDPTTYVSGGVGTVGSGSTAVVGSAAPPSGTTGYYQESDGTLEELIYGKPAGNCAGTSGDCGILNIDGSVWLDGVLDPVLESGYDPADGDSFLFMTFTGALTGQFGSVENRYFNGNTQQWVVTYGSDFVELTAEAYTPGGPSSGTPEPASLLLAGVGLAAVVGFARRRRKAKAAL